MGASSKKTRFRAIAGRVRSKKPKAKAKGRRQVRLRPPPARFRPPILEGGTGWIGGDLSRADFYGDDAGKPLFVDTSVIIAASVAEHPSHQAARDAVDQLVRDQMPLCISPQVCREILAVLTRQPVAGRTFTAEEALNRLPWPPWSHSSRVSE